MKSTDVAEYLKNNPKFFEEHAEMMSEITIPHPYGGRTISLSERQLLTLREKNKLLEKKLHEMVEFAQYNELLQQKVHQFACSLYAPNNFLDPGSAEDMAHIITRNLKEIFAVPHAVLHLWKTHPSDMEIIALVDKQLKSICTHRAMHNTQLWFGEIAPQLRSFALLPLRSKNLSTGLLVLASEDDQRFYPDMGTQFLDRIAEITSSAINPFL